MLNSRQKKNSQLSIKETKDQPQLSSLKSDSDYCLSWWNCVTGEKRKDQGTWQESNFNIIEKKYHPCLGSVWGGQCTHVGVNRTNVDNFTALRRRGEGEGHTSEQMEEKGTGQLPFSYSEGGFTFALLTCLSRLV